MKVNLWDRLLEEEIFSGFEEEERDSLFLLFSRLNDRKSFKNYILEILNLKRRNCNSFLEILNKLLYTI